MPDGLKLAQLATLIAQSGQGAASYDPGQAALMKNTIGSGQSAIEAEAKKKAEKKAKSKNKGILSTVGTVGALAAAPFTGGASLELLPVLAGAGGALDSAIAGDGQGAVQNAMDAGMGYMMSKSMPKGTGDVIDVKSKSIDPLPDAVPMATETDPSFGAKSLPAPVTATAGTPDPGFGGTVSSAALPAPTTPSTTPAPSTGGGGRKTPMGLVGPLAGLMTYGASRVGARNKTAPPKPMDAKTMSGPGRMPPDAATMTPAALRGMNDATKLAMMPTRDGQPLKTAAQARALGYTEEEIRQMRKSGQITDAGGFIPNLFGV